MLRVVETLWEATISSRRHGHLRRTVLATLGGLLFASVAGWAGSPVAASAIRPAAPRPVDRVVIDVVKVNGSGCRPGTAAVAVSPDNAAFTVTYSGYLAQVGVGAGKKDAQKDCGIRLKVGVPKGFTYTVAGIDYRGFASLESGATGRINASYSFQGASQTMSTSHPFTGPMSDDWLVTDPAPAAFEPCGKKRALDIATEMVVDAGGSDPKTTTSLLSMDSTDGSIATTYRLAWKTC